MSILLLPLPRPTFSVRERVKIRHDGHSSVSILTLRDNYLVKTKCSQCKTFAIGRSSALFRAS